MANDVDIKIRLQAAKAQAQLAKFNSQLEIAAQRQQQAGLKTQILQKRLDRVANNSQKASNSFSILNISLASFIGNITSRAVSAGVTTLVNGFRNIVDNGRNFEEALIQISKTTGLSIGEVQDLGKEIQQLARRLPIATEGLLDIAKVAGQLGIQSRDDILAFTETLGRLQLATDIAGEEGSQSVARILTITGELRENGSENIEKFGTVITQLGNNFAATESQILRVANEVAKGTTVFGVSSEDVLGLATAFKVTGSEAEISGSTIQKIFADIGKASSSGGDKLKLFADSAGLTTTEFQKLFRDDPTAAFIKLAEGLGRAGLRGEELTKRLVELGFADRRVIKSLGPLVTQYQTLADSINTARKEAVEQNALTEETRKAQNSLNSDIQKLNNSFQELSTTIFNDLGPGLRDITQLATRLLKAIIDNESKVRSWSKTIIEAGKNTLIWLTPLKGLVLAYKALNLVLPETQREVVNLNDASTNYLNTLSEVTGQVTQQNGNYVELNQTLKETRDNYVQIKDVQIEAGQAGSDAAKKTLLFEKDKTKELKKFFKEEEVAKLESNFAILQSLKEREAFESFVASEGAKRRSEAFKATIGLDRATIEAERKKQQELKAIRDEFFQLEQEQRSLAFQQQMIDQENNQIFTDERLRQVQEFFTKREELEIQGKIRSALTEEERQLAIENALIEGQRRRIAAELKFQEQMVNVEKDANKIIEQDNKELIDQKLALRRSDVRSFRETSNLITAIAGKESKAAFLVSQGVAFAENIIRTQQEIATVRAAFAYAPPVAEALAAKARIQGVIRGATIAATTVGGFEHGGVVPGNSFSGDNVVANVNSGEMILNRQQQSQLFALANGQGNAAQQEIVVNTKVQLNEETIAEAVSRQVANGLILGEVQ